jgi:hypothetical protein
MPTMVRRTQPVLRLWVNNDPDLLAGLRLTRRHWPSDRGFNQGRPLNLILKGRR